MSRSVFREYEWKAAGHVCRYCLGRIFERKDATGKRFHACADCEREAPTPRVESICCCGAGEVDKAGRTIRRLGLYCVENPNPSLESPSFIVAEYQGAPQRPAPRARVRRETDGDLPLFPGEE